MENFLQACLMLEIFLIMIGLILPLGLAKARRSRRRNPNFRAVRVLGSLALGALADNTFVKSAIGETGQEYIAISMDCYAAIKNHTAAEGPIAWGIAHGDYTVTEIKEWWESNGSIAGDKVQDEYRRRLIRQVGIFPGLATDEVLYDGRAKRVKLGFRIQESKTLSLWAVNLSDGTLTTGTLVDLTATLYLRLT